VNSIRFGASESNPKCTTGEDIGKSIFRTHSTTSGSDGTKDHSNDRVLRKFTLFASYGIHNTKRSLYIP